MGARLVAGDVPDLRFAASDAGWQEAARWHFIKHRGASALSGLLRPVAQFYPARSLRFGLDYFRLIETGGGD
jgi:hypothetical protein